MPVPSEEKLGEQPQVIVNCFDYDGCVDQGNESGSCFNFLVQLEAIIKAKLPVDSVRPKVRVGSSVVTQFYSSSSSSLKA